MVLSLVQNQKYCIGGYRPGKKPEHTKHHHKGRFQADQLPRKVDLRK